MECQRQVNAEQLIRALSHTERMALLRFLSEPRSESDLQREFPAVPVAEVRRSISYLDAARWIHACRVPSGGQGWSLDPGTVHSAIAWTVHAIPGAVPSRNFCATQVSFELVVLRRRSCLSVLDAIRAGVSTHRELVTVTGLQSGTVSDAIGRLQLASILEDFRVVSHVELHLLRFLYELVIP